METSNSGKGVVTFYHSKGIEDFVNKYLNKFVGENLIMIDKNLIDIQKELKKIKKVI